MRAGRCFVTLLASVVVSGLLPFWPDFFALWTHGAVPYDPMLAITLLIGTGAVAPSILALGYANYSNRGDLLVRTKGLQLAVFLMLSVLLIHPLGPLGAAIAVVASDLLIQFGLLGRHHYRANAGAAVSPCCFSGGGHDPRDVGRAGRWERSSGHGCRARGLTRFAGECALWLFVVALVASPLASARIRNRLIAEIPQ